MATTIINPAPANESSNNILGFFLIIVLFITFAAAFFIYVLPSIRQGLTGGGQVNIPKDINVNVQQSK